MITQIAEFWSSQTSRLMLTYLAIIMAMSITFSGIIYVTSAQQLERQLAEDAYVDEIGRFGPTPRVQAYIEAMVIEGKRELLLRLYVLNLIMALFGAAFSYMLARWTLEPIERSLDAQTRFISDASHELRTPLTAIRTMNEVALRRKKLTIKEAKDTIQSNLDDVRRLQHMSSLLLELAATDRILNLAPTQVQDIVSQAMTDVAITAQGRDITIDDQTGRDKVMADVVPASQALTILLDNAIKYSPEGSTITISCNRLTRGRVALNVTDEGPGIAREDQQKIFSRFYRSDQARTREGSGGYGLGLEIAQNIARAHHGSIELRSQPDKGSTFSLVLQLAKQ